MCRVRCDSCPARPELDLHGNFHEKATKGREKIDVLEWIELYWLKNQFWIVIMPDISEAFGMILVTYRFSLRYFEHLGSVGHCQKRVYLLEFRSDVRSLPDDVT